MIIQHNMAALNTNRQIGNTGRLLAKNAERLNSGYKINRYRNSFNYFIYQKKQYHKNI